jgi:hypothetical protein
MPSTKMSVLASRGLASNQKGKCRACHLFRRRRRPKGRRASVQKASEKTLRLNRPCPKELTRSKSIVRVHITWLEAQMHPAAIVQFERTAREFSLWRSVPDEDRSPAPAWWWQPAIEVIAQQEQMTALLCYRLELPVGSTYAAGAAVLMGTLANQTSLPWPDESPRKIGKVKSVV